MSLTGTIDVSLYLKIIISILGLAYLVSPMDIIPEILIPYLGWIDDSLVLGIIFYMLRYNRLPDFTFFRDRMAGRPNRRQTFYKPGFNPDSSQKTRDRQSDQYRSGTESGPQTESQNSQTGSTGADPARSSKSPHEILGVPKHASKSEIQAAYKAAVKKYHPDKLSHLGEEFAHLANKKFLEIQNAYTELINRSDSNI